MTVDKRRVIILNDTAPRENGRYVLYFMQHSQRALDNPALEHAASLANALDAPLRVLFVLDPTYPEANQRHFSFLIQGLVDVREDLKQRGAWFTLKIGSPVDEVVSLAADAAVVVTDRGYLRHLVKWRASIATHCQCRMEMVEGDVIVPTEAASTKREVGARTLRPKLHRLVPEFSEPITPVPLKRRVPSAAGNDDGHHLLDEPAQLLDSLGVSASVLPVKGFHGGSRAAEERLKTFVAEALRQYGTGRADIVTRRLSKLSPYLHLGQISPVTIYRTIKDATAGADNEASFLDEMIVRRELAVNFVVNTDDYDAFSALPGWAQDTLKTHQGDPRQNIYSVGELEAGKTHDPYWNAAMREMRITGYLHNHLRMYWGKQIITYTARPEEAFEVTTYLNNKYLLDGRDANSYANIAWIFGVHDRGWPERAIFGKVRSMMPSGLKRKFDVDAYVRWARHLTDA